MNFKLKHGGKPEFTPEFVELIVTTCLKNKGSLSIDNLSNLIGVGKEQTKKDNFEELLKFGDEYGFWNFDTKSNINIANFERFDNLPWSSMTFAKFLREALSKKNLVTDKEWSSLSALLAWSYSLKLTKFDLSEGKSYQIPNKWGDFERKEISIPLREICKNETQWNITKKWLKSFGMVFESKDSMNPFPAEFYEFATFAVKKNHPKTKLEDLVLRFRASFVFLPNGDLGRFWTRYVKELLAKKEKASELRDEGLDDELVLSQQESFVLHLLELKGIIKLGLTNDASSRYLMAFPMPKREISYFVGSEIE